MARSTGPSLHCPECKAANWSGSSVCFLCGHSLDGGSSRPKAYDGDQVAGIV